MNELLRFTSTGTNGVNILLPPKFEFVFYNDKLEMYKKSIISAFQREDILSNINTGIVGIKTIFQLCLIYMFKRYYL